jgi:hypothetical protein
MSKMPTVLLLTSPTLVVLGCEGSAVRTISSGSHVPYSDAQWAKIEDKQVEKLHVIVWGNHAGATHAAVEMLQHSGATIVERARLQELLDQQQIRLTQTSDDHFHVLKVGRLAGATQVVFVEVSDKPDSVAVRSVDLDTGAVRWKGHSTLTQPITDPEVAIALMTKAPMKRATCALERGRVWVEYGSEHAGLWGCRKKETN